MDAIQAASARWFSSIYSGRPAPETGSLSLSLPLSFFPSAVKCAGNATNYRLAHGHTRRLPRVRTLALRSLAAVNASRRRNVLAKRICPVSKGRQVERCNKDSRRRNCLKRKIGRAPVMRFPTSYGCCCCCCCTCHEVQSTQQDFNKLNALCIFLFSRFNLPRQKISFN